MSADLERDLGAWSRGDLARERLLATHGAMAAGTVALHERLAGIAAATAIPDPEAGWAALAEKIETPAPVVPLRRHARRRRTVSVLVAAAILVGGSAFAAVWRSSHPATPPARSGATVTGVPAAGAHWTGASGDRRPIPPPSAAGASGGPSGGATGATADGTRGSGSTTSGGGPKSTDDPLDRDHGTGNDGSHNDQGSGNNGTSGTLPHVSHGGGH